ACNFRWHNLCSALPPLSSTQECSWWFEYVPVEPVAAKHTGALPKEDGMTQTDSMDQQTMVASRPLHIEDQITVRVPVHRAYEVWRDFTRFPEFMSNVEEVRPIGGNRYHWVARIFGIQQEWDAEVTETSPDRRVAWRSVTGAPNSGVVTFDEREPGVTEVWVAMEYTPPAGQVGKALDKLTKTTQREVKEDL